MKKTIFLLIASIITLQSCNFNSTGTKKNEAIDKRKREEIKAMNDKLFKALKSNDVNAVKSMFSDSLKASINFDEFVKNVNSTLTLENYSVMDEYNFRSLKDTNVCVLDSDKGNVNDYQVKFTLPNKEVYSTLILVPKGKNEFLVLISYGKVGEDWKVNMFYSGQHRLFGKTAPDYYQMAKESVGKGNYIDAINYGSVSKELLRIKAEFFNYKNEDTMNVFFEKLKKDVNEKYQLPIALTNIESKPEIYNISPQITADGVFPKVYYKSTILLTDEAALKEENEAVKKQASQLFSGLNENKSYVFYFVSNELPAEGRVGEQYGFVDTLKVK